MKAAILALPQNVAQRPLKIVDVPAPAPIVEHLLLRVRACAVCRTDLHIVEGELAPTRASLIPGHQIVDEVVAGDTHKLPPGTRVGVSWLGGVDGICPYCRLGRESLCDLPTYPPDSP